MGKLLDKLGLEKKSCLLLEVSEERFIELLVDYLDVDRFNLLEIFSTNQRKYKGKVTNGFLSIKRKRRLFGSRFLLRSKGTFQYENDRLKVELTSTTWNWYTTFMYLIISIFYLIIFFQSFNHLHHITSGWIVFPLLFLHFILMVGGPLLLLKKSLLVGIQTLESDLKMLIRKKNSIYKSPLH